MKTRTSTKLLGIVFSLVLLLGMMPMVAMAEYDEVGTTYVRVNSADEIVPNANYIILGEYDVEGVETTYFAMSDMTNTYDDIRVGLTPTTYTDEGTPHFKLADDKQSLTLHSESVLKIRLRSANFGGHEDLYRMQIGDEGYLYACCNSYYYYHVSCCRELPVLKYTNGETSWHFSMGDNGYWQISSYMYANSVTDAATLVFNDVYRDFMSYQYADNVRMKGEEYFFTDYIAEDKDTNILLYREVCTHKSSAVTHVEAAAATCSSAGVTEYWYCTSCETVFSDASMTTEMNLTDAFIAPTAHTDSCGHAAETLKFEPYTEDYMSSDQHGKSFLLIGKSGEKYYALGNITNADGSRNAVEVYPNENGIIPASSDAAEFLVYDTTNAYSYLVDGCYLSADGNRIIAYDKALYGSSIYIPDPVRFVISDYDTGVGSFYADANDGQSDEFIVFDAENLCFKAQTEKRDSTYLYYQLCTHQNIAHVKAADPTCTKPGTEEYWYCEECYNYYQNHNFETPVESENDYGYISEIDFSIPALGHSYSDGACENCGMKVPVYSKVTSLDDINEKDMYIIVAEVGGKTYALGMPSLQEDAIPMSLNGAAGNAVEVQVAADGTISVLGKDVAEVMLDVNPDEWDLSDFGLTTVMPLLDNYAIPAFQSYGMEEDGYIAAPYYYDNFYPRVDSSAWVIDFYSTNADENTYRDMDGRTHAEQVARGNIGTNIGEGNLLLYAAHYEAVGGAMFTLRFRVYNNEGTVQNYFIAGEDWMLEGSPGWDYVTDTTPTNDEQYAVWLYRYTAGPTHVCAWSDWTDDNNGTTHSRTCADCGKTETKNHSMSDWTIVEAATCTESGSKTRSCSYCDFSETEVITATGHDWVRGTAQDGKVIDSCSRCDATRTHSLLPNGMNVAVSDTAETTLKKELTAAEAARVEAGESYQFYLDSFDISGEVSANEQELLDDVLEQELEGYKVGSYMDISLYKQIGDDKATALTELDEPIPVVIDIPENLQNTSKYIERTYDVVRIHNGSSDVLGGTYDAENQTFTFETDAFSTYILVYHDLRLGGMLGDVNDDDTVNVLDLMYLANYFAKGEIINQANADVNGDGLLDVRDLMFLANVFAGKETLS